ncbi:hypothetical protein EGI26_07995 [Lacihabitans sp. CCS-44]|uniref:hypothetical protein n=1 Tax=Lacihabitans sp. CCS-44 TaxID=2487331 RepID=UPI0020CBC659|nr:hypothetical protein [Lacihabitans sp. CCS-44]MCP9755090.1 hypothetical protein [Lacihabitans sp. CCS-44]
MKKQIISHNNFTTLIYSNGTNHIEKGHISVSKNEIIDILNQFNVDFDEVLIYKNYLIERDHISHSEYAFGHYHSTIKNLILKNCDFDTSVVFDLSLQIETIMFIDCKFKASLKINNPKCKIFLENVKVENDFLLDGDSRVTENTVIISNTTVKNHLIFKNFQKFNLLKIIGEKSYAKKTVISNVNGKNIAFKGITKNGNLNLTWDENKNINNEIENLLLESTNFEIIDLFQTTIHGSLKIKNVQIQDNLIVKSCLISNIQINSSIDIKYSIIENSTIKTINFLNSQFTKSNEFVLAENTKINSFQSISSRLGEIVIKCKIESVEFISKGKKNNEMVKLLIIESVIDYLSLKNVVIHKELNISGNIEHILFENSNFREYVDISLKTISDQVSNSSINLRCNIFHQYFSINDSFLHEFEFFQNTFLDIFELNYLTLTENLSIIDSMFFGELIINNKSELNAFLIENSFLKKLTITNNCNIDSIKVTKKSLIHFFSPFDKKDFEYYFENSIINSISFENTSLSKNSSFNFSDCQINFIEFSSVNNYGFIYFRNSKPIFFYLDMVIAKSAKLLNLSISEMGKQEFIKNIGPSLYKAEICFLNSSLGNIEFIGFAFSQYSFKFLNSKMLNLFIAGDEFPEIIEVSEIDKKNQTKADYNQLVLAYNQLKKIAENNGDIIRTSLMHAKALKFQHKVLKKTPNTGYERAVFLFNGLSNNHGESWGKAFWFIIISSVSLFTLFIIPTSKYAIVGSFDNSIITDYLKFIDPFQKNNYDEFGWFSNLIYFLNKIVFGYGVFQLVTAFRRHGKK